MINSWPSLHYKKNLKSKSVYYNDSNTMYIKLKISTVTLTIQRV